MTSPARTYRWLFWTLALAGFAVDQTTKYGVFAWRYSDVPRPTVSGHLVCENPYTVAPGVFDLVARYTVQPWSPDEPFYALRTISGPNRPYLNHGALFGFASDTSFGNTVFLSISVVAALGIMVWSLRASAARDRYLCFALGLILAGALGNFYDRVVFGGVRDFLHWYKWYDWPVFNFADCCLVCGAGLLMLEAFLRTPTPEQPPAQTAAAPVQETVAS
ncbi:MAG: signal peptidase II [Gemmataceae bacterium]|nr:signal peptidase II [Gemmataceae bacterium]